VVIIRLGQLEINFARYQARIGDSLLMLTPTEFKLLAFLVQNRGKTFSRKQLADEVWDYGYGNGDRTVDNCISRLRAKIDRSSAHPCCLLTVWGKGYRFE
jgi:DNA-binding response OmpR family regulator